MSTGQIGSWQSEEYVGRWPARTSSAGSRAAAAGLHRAAGRGNRGPARRRPRLRRRAVPRRLLAVVPIGARDLVRLVRAHARAGACVPCRVRRSHHVRRRSCGGARAAGIEQADLVVSSRALHHLTPEDRRGVSRGTRAAEPGRLFFNLDHVGWAGDSESATGASATVHGQASREAQPPRRTSLSSRCPTTCSSTPG